MQNCKECKKQMDLKYSAKQWRSFECMNTRCKEFDKLKIINNKIEDDIAFAIFGKGFKR